MNEVIFQNNFIGFLLIICSNRIYYEKDIVYHM